jgi:hypothetical protein
MKPKNYKKNDFFIIQQNLKPFFRTKTTDLRLLITPYSVSLSLIMTNKRLFQYIPKMQSYMPTSKPFDIKIETDVSQLIVSDI